MKTLGFASLAILPILAVLLIGSIAPVIIHHQSFDDLASGNTATQLSHSIPSSSSSFPDLVNTFLKGHANSKFYLDQLDEPLQTTTSTNPADLHGIGHLQDLGYNGSDVVVAVIDTGVSSEHQEFEGRILEEISFVDPQYGYATSEGVDDTIGHGTAVSSLVLGADIGMATKAQLVSIKIVQSDELITSYGMVAGILYAAMHEEVDIISISISEPEEGAGTDVLEKAVGFAVAQGKIVVDSAGNAGNKYYSVGSPGSSSHVITVGATYSNLGITTFSSKGPTYRLEAKPDVLAVGSQLTVAGLGTGYTTKSGTSFSTPIVAGIAASLLSAVNEEFSVPSNNVVGTIKAALHAGATDLDGSWFRYGSGFVNASKSWELLSSQFSASIISKSQNSVPEMAYLFPNHIDSTGYRSSVAAGQILTQKITAITGFPSDSLWTINRIEGNASFVSISLDNGYFSSNHSQVYSLDIHPLESTSPGSYQSIIFLSSPLGNEYTISLEIEVTEPASASMLIDILHTPWSSATFNRLDRYYGHDMKGMVKIFEDHGIWINELYEGELSYDILKNYDILFIPSAFTTISPLYFDHATTRSTTLTPGEVFAIHKFRAQGGDLIVDFAGISDNDKIFDTTTTDKASILSVMSILGLELEDNQMQDDTSLTLSTMLNSSNLYNSALSARTGSNGILQGLPVTEIGDTVSSAISFGEKSRSFIINSRNWRDDAATVSISPTKYFAESIVDWMIDDGLHSIIFEKNQDMLSLTLDYSSGGVIDLNLFDIDVYYDGSKQQITDIRTSGSSVKVQIPSLSKGLVDLSFSYNRTYMDYSKFVNFIDVDYYKIEGETKFEIETLFENFSEQSLSYELELLADPIPENNFRFTNGYDIIDYHTFEDNTLEFVVNASLLDYIDRNGTDQSYSLGFDIIDAYGNLFQFTFVLQFYPDLASVSGTGSDNSAIYFGAIALSGIFLAVLYSRRKIKKI